MPESLLPRRQGVSFLNMSEGVFISLEKEAYRELQSIVYSFNDHYGISYLKKDQYDIAISALKKLNNTGCYTRREIILAAWIFKTQRGNEKKIRELIESEPRLHAQKFIGKKNVRDMIFKRDGRCLRCGSNERLTIDHIISIRNGGENKLSNLQTLCISCNSSKSARFIDYREGARCVESKRNKQ